ncbi:protein Shroom2 isoform X2 [Pelobates fuscus]|uniref:protein Shroom2 isoform X2 n=1 Tax=Pelobates fuscus TaxID=191477 RepID=UPI002FE4C321
MDNLESRLGQDRFLHDDMRLHQGMVDQGQTVMVDRKVVEGYRYVDVLLTGGAPWGFTLKGGMEHGELLIITKVEEGSKAADTLMAGDEIVNINDQPLSGYRQEAIALVKGSYKTLKMIVKRRNDVACRPHSWHSAKFLEGPMEIPTSQLSKTNAVSWNSRYNSSGSSQDLWNQTNLQRNSGHFSSVGSMDSIDQPYQFGRLSSAKSNNSIDQLGNQSKRDSAYGSFSTSFMNTDQALSKTGCTSTENILYKINEWDNTKQDYGKTEPFLTETRGHEDKQGYPSPSSPYEYNKPKRTDDLADGRHSSRSNFGPVWYVPDTKKTSSSPPPPLPPVRRDSYAATKTHEKPSAPAQSDMACTQHFNVASRSHQRPDRNSEIPDYQQRLVRVADRTLADMRRISNSSYNDSMDQYASSYNDKYHSNMPNARRLQSLSTNDVRFAQPTYSYHQRQHSDESTLFPNARSSTSHKSHQQQMTYYTGSHESDADAAQIYNPHPVRISSSSTSNNEGKPKVDCNGQNRLNYLSTKQPLQGTIMQHHYKEEYDKQETSFGRISALQENAATYTQVTSHCLPQQSSEPSPENCETLNLKITEKNDDHFSNNDRFPHKKNSEYHEDPYNRFSQAENTDKNALNKKCRSYQKDYSWVEEEGAKISPQVTPMLHSLTQEGRNRSDTFPEIENEKQPFSDAGKQSRRSDRFATTLRNEIQQRRARLQKSKSTVALTESSEMENSESWTQDSMESVTRSSDGSFSSTYKNHLKEAQARVLRATSFQRRDLEPGLADHSSVSPDRKMHGSNVSLSVFPPDVSPSIDQIITKQNMVPGSSQNIPRIGGRKRFTAQQKLRSYSEPEKMNEVGISEDNHHQNSSVPKGVVGSFADRWKFFEETSKPSQPKNASKVSPRSQEEEKNMLHHIKDRENEPPEPWHDKSARAASIGPEPNQNKSQTNRFQQPVFYKSTDNVTTEQPQRLGTFAEYEASWKEQKKPLERKNSGRCHSADNILDGGHEQISKSQYIHERSRSSPTTDFYAQGAIVNAKEKAPDSARESTERSAVTHCSRSRQGSSQRIAEVEDREETSRFGEDSYNNNWKPPVNSPKKTEAHNASQETRVRSGTLPSDYRFVNENVNQGNQDSCYSVVSILETRSETRNVSHADGENQWEDQVSVNKQRRSAPQRPPPPKLDKYWRQNGSTSSLTTSSESLITAQGRGVQSHSPNPLDSAKPEPSQVQQLVVTDKYLSIPLHEQHYSGPSQNENLHLEKKLFDSQPVEPTKFSYLQKPVMERSRSPSPQFAPQKLTDKPPLLVQDENMSRIERVIDNTTVKMVPIKIVHSESHAEKESRNNLLSAIEPPALPSGLAKDQLKTLSTSEQSYSRFCAYTRHDPDPEDLSGATDNIVTQESVENKVPSPTPNNVKSKVVYADLKSEELMREIVGKDKSLADILDPNTKMKTTMDLMEGIFQKDENLLEEAQQRRKLNPKIPSPRPSDEKKDEQNVTAAISLTTSSAYYSTSAPKAELLIKMKDMQEQQHTEESSEDELDHNLFEKKQELIDSISKKLQVLREARETLLEDIQSNNALGEEVEVIVKEVCKSNEFDKFRMFIGDLEKIVNLLLSLSGRLARVENALNNLDETASPEERRTLVEKRKLLTTQHEDAKELKENLDRRERTVFEILASYLNEENLADYEHFVKMKSALILEQRELEDKIKLGEEQLKCLTDSLPSERLK